MAAWRRERHLEQEESACRCHAVLWMPEILLTGILATAGWPADWPLCPAGTGHQMFEDTTLMQVLTLLSHTW